MPFRINPARINTSQNVSFNGTSAQSAELSGHVVRLVAKTADCRVAIGVNPTAASTSTFLPVGIPEYFTISPGDKVAVIQDASSGTLNITECS